MFPPLVLDRPTARRFVRSALGLGAPHASVASALTHHGYVQIDPINVCGRMHDLILRNRVANYREGELLAHVHAASRPGFEHFVRVRSTGTLAAFPREAWPFVNAEITRNFGAKRKLPAGQEKLAKQILGEIAARGPLKSDDIEHDARATTGWGTDGRAVKVVLERLFARGRVLITRRDNFRRVYDLPERVLPPEVLAAPAASPRASARWHAELILRQRRLVVLRKAELALVGDLVQAIKIDGLPLLHCLRADLPLLDQDVSADAGPRLLAPLDPLIYDRALTEKLWDFAYRWEVYHPPGKRTRGYYALPVLAEGEIVGHVDPKANRALGKLAIVSRQVRRGVSVRNAERELARFLSLR